MEVTTKILSIISQNADCGKEIRPTDRIGEDLGIDSLDKLMIIHDLEDEFGITVEQEELKGLNVVQDIVDKLLEKVPEGQT